MNSSTEQDRKAALVRTPGISGGVMVLALIAAHLLAVVASFFLAYLLRVFLGDRGVFFSALSHGLENYLAYWPLIFLWPIVFWREGLYPGHWLIPEVELRKLIEGTTLAGLLVIALTFATQTGTTFSRPILIGWWLVTLVLVPLNHVGTKAILSSLYRPRPAVLLGTNPAAQQIADTISRERFPPFELVAAFTHVGETGWQEPGRVPIVGEADQASTWAHARGVDTILVVVPDLPDAQLVRLTDRLGASFQRVLIVPDLFGMSVAETEVRSLDGYLALEVRKNLLLRRNRIVKRALDLVLAVGLCLLAAPLALVIAVALAAEGQGSVLFSHFRIGLAGKPFRAWKFRTMVRDPDTVLQTAFAEDPELKREWQANRKLRHDPRLTSMGRLLRRFSLDELPQLWNVLNWEMSLVGPRPIVEHETAKYGEAFELYTQVRPGLTGLWQVSGRSDLSYPERVRLDAYYVRNWSIWLDLVILIRTFVVVVSGQGAY